MIRQLYEGNDGNKVFWKVLFNIGDIHKVKIYKVLYILSDYTTAICEKMIE